MWKLACVGLLLGFLPALARVVDAIEEVTALHQLVPVPPTSAG